MRRPAHSARNAALAGAVVIATVLGAVATPAQAGAPASVGAGVEDNKRKVDASIGDLRNQLEDTSADLARAFLALQVTQKQLVVAQVALAKAQADLAAARARDVELAGRLTVAQATEQKAVDDLGANANDVASTTKTIGAIARQAYQTGGLGELGVALQAQSADDFATRVVLVDTAMRVQGGALNRLAVVRAETSAKRARLTAVRRQVALLRAQAAANLVRAGQLQAQAAAATSRVQTLLVQQRQQAAAIQARKAAEQRRLNDLQAESDRLQAVLVERARQARLRAQRQAAARRAAAARAAEARSRSSHSHSSGGSSSGSADSGGYLSYPVNAPVSSEFGMRYHPILHYWRLHAGIDFAAACGTPVRAAASGDIVSAGWAGGYGNRVVVDHGLIGNVDLATTYNHLTRIVQSGGHVSRGEVLGYSGTTGESTGCHLHFETREDGTPVNPRKWL